MSQHTTDVVSRAMGKDRRRRAAQKNRGIHRSLIGVEAMRIERARRFELGQNQGFNRI
jgi:hypothetical protein